MQSAFLHRTRMWSFLISPLRRKENSLTGRYRAVIMDMSIRTPLYRCLVLVIIVIVKRRDRQLVISCLFALRCGVRDSNMCKKI